MARAIAEVDEEAAERIALLSGLLLMAVSYVFSPALVLPLFLVILFSLVMPLAQILALFLKERMEPAMWIRLPLLPVFFALDIFAAMRAMLDTVLNRARFWTRTERVEIPQ